VKIWCMQKLVLQYFYSTAWRTFLIKSIRFFH